MPLFPLCVNHNFFSTENSEGGRFTSTHVMAGFYTFGMLCAYHGMEGALSYMKTSYEARLYCSIQPTLIGSVYNWNLYLSVVKRCDIFSRCMKKYIEEEFEEKLKMVTRHVVMFDDNCDCMTVQLKLKTNSPQNVFIEEIDHDGTLCHDYIIRHVDGCPPLLTYKIHGKPNCSLKLKFTLHSLTEENHFIIRQYYFPGKYCIKNSP